MTLSWALCAAAFSLLAGLSARLGELALPANAGKRWVWLASLAVSVLVSAGALLTGGAWPGGWLAEAPAVDLAALLAHAVTDGSGGATEAPPPLPGPSLALVMGVAWAACSLLLLAGYAALWIRFAGAAAEWRPGLVDGEPVRVAQRLGPAVIGVRRATIVVPEWVLRADAAEQHMILVHEKEHARARDHVLLALAPLLVVAMPWNLPLWWQLRRLRLAVEVDCDRRVLRQGIGVRDYGTLLIDIAGRSFPMPATFAALAEPRTLLERRIIAMSAHPRAGRVRSAALAAAATLLLVTAFEAFALLTPRAAALEPAGEQQLTAAQYHFMATDSPLVVVNGVIIADGNIERAVGDAAILRVDVLKGPAAVERFGQEGSRGVILITTSETRSGEVVTLRASRAAQGADSVRSVRVRPAQAPTADSPLYVIDGVIIGTADPTRSLDPDQIERIEVVKGPAAERLYGSRGANGVIIITTKQRP